MRKMWGIFQYFFPTKLMPQFQKRAINYYHGPESPEVEVRSLLNQSTGGSVDLTRNEDTGIATLCLNHAERKNAISGKMIVDLQDAVNSLKEWKTGKGLIVCGAGKTFCSGGDLNMARKFSNADYGFHMATFMQKALYDLETLPLLSVAVIEGSGAIGGGAEIAIACDFRLFASNCGGIGFVHGRMGITPAWGGCTRLVHAVGYTKALGLLAAAKRVTCEEALSLGLGDGIIEAENALTEAEEWLRSRLKSDVTVVKALKSMAHNAKVMSFEDSLMEEKRIFAPTWGGPANKAALAQNIKHRI